MNTNKPHKQYDAWTWQEPGTTWSGRGIYHITLTQSDRSSPMLGELAIPGDDPEQATVTPSALGREVVRCMYAIPEHHPEVELLAYQLMPDHLHFVMQVMRHMPTGIKKVVQGFWQGCKRAEKAAILSPDNERTAAEKDSSVERDSIPQSSALEGAASLFAEMPHIRPMSSRGQLQHMIRYVHDNPRRLAFRRLHPDRLRVAHGVEIGGRTYDAIGNMLLLCADSYRTVHVRRIWERQAQEGDSSPLRDYQNDCILAARGGSICISPFISPEERRVRDRLLLEKLPFIVLHPGDFPPLFKPDGELIEACAEGRLLILSAESYADERHHITREQCLQLNRMAEELADALGRQRG